MIFCKKFTCFTLLSTCLLNVLFFIGLASAQDQGRAEPVSNKIRSIDGVVAVVNTGFVTRKEIDDRIAALKKQGVKLPEDGALRKNILERIILEKILLDSNLTLVKIKIRSY